MWFGNKTAGFSQDSWVVGQAYPPTSQVPLYNTFHHISYLFPLSTDNIELDHFQVPFKLYKNMILIYFACQRFIQTSKAS